MADTRPKHKPNEKHTLDEVLKSLQDLVRNEVLDKPAPPAAPPPPVVATPAAPATGPDMRSIIGSLEDLLAGDLNSDDKPQVTAKPVAIPAAPKSEVPPARPAPTPTPTEKPAASKPAAKAAPEPIVQHEEPPAPIAPLPPMQALTDEEFDVPSFEDADEPDAPSLLDAPDGEIPFDAEIEALASELADAIEHEKTGLDTAPVQLTAGTPLPENKSPDKTSDAPSLELAPGKPSTTAETKAAQQPELPLTPEPPHEETKQDTTPDEVVLPAIEVEEASWAEAEAAFADIASELQAAADDIAPVPADDSARPSNAMSVDFTPSAPSALAQEAPVENAAPAETIPAKPENSIDFTTSKKIKSGNAAPVAAAPVIDTPATPVAATNSVDFTPSAKTSPAPQAPTAETAPAEKTIATADAIDFAPTATPAKEPAAATPPDETIELLDDSFELELAAPGTYEAKTNESLDDLTPPLAEEEMPLRETAPHDVEPMFDETPTETLDADNGTLGGSIELELAAPPEALTADTVTDEIATPAPVVEEIAAAAPPADKPDAPVENIVAAAAPEPKPEPPVPELVLALTPGPAAQEPAAKKPTTPPQTAAPAADDIPILQDVALASPQTPAKLAPATPVPKNIRDMAVKVVAKLNIELRKSGKPPLDAKTINRLQQLLGESLEQTNKK